MIDRRRTDTACRIASVTGSRRSRRRVRAASDESAVRDGLDFDQQVAAADIAAQAA